MQCCASTTLALALAPAHALISIVAIVILVTRGRRSPEQVALRGAVLVSDQRQTGLVGAPAFGGAVRSTLVPSSLCSLVQRRGTKRMMIPTPSDLFGLCHLQPDARCLIGLVQRSGAALRCHRVLAERKGGDFGRDFVCPYVYP